MSKPTDPTEATVKRLFAVSGNQCPFPNCKNKLVTGEKVTGRICHIEAASKGGSRFNEKQSDAERRSFGNIILMCPIHHDVIDADEEAYTVERLKKMKAEHELKNAGGQESSDAATLQFLTNIHDNTLTSGSIIQTFHQSGGQNAHKIINNTPPPRYVDTTLRNSLVKALRPLPPENFRILVTMDDGEAFSFATEINHALHSAGWSSEAGVIQTTATPPFNPLEVIMPELNVSTQVLCQTLVNAGYDVCGAHIPTNQSVEFRIGRQV